MSELHAPVYKPGSSASRVCELRMGFIYTTKRQRNLESTRFAKKNKNNRESNVSEKMKGLKFEFLELRREISRLVVFYKSLHGQTALPLPDYLVRENTNSSRLSDICMCQPGHRFISIVFSTELQRTAVDYQKHVCLQPLWAHKQLGMQI